MPEPSVADTVRRILVEQPVVDVHTHLCDPGMGDLLLTGVDELLTYHYHVAELFRARPDLDPDAFWELSKTGQADLVWRELFVERSPLSEVGRGIVRLFKELGLDPAARDLREARAFSERHDARGLVDKVFEIAGVREVYMTNDPLDAAERSHWLDGFERDPRFVACLRLDSAIMDWPRAVTELRALDYDVDESFSERSLRELRRYLREWQQRMQARYMAVSLPPKLRYPGGDAPWLELLVDAVIPEAIELDVPVALMIGVRRQVNRRLRMAGDSVGRTDVASLERLAADQPRARFYVTVLSRESQHALCVAGRKFANIVPFGAWWFMNNSGLYKELTAMRLDLLGPTFIAQHSDARVLEQLVFKWGRSREWLADVLVEHYEDLAACGRVPTEADVRRDANVLLGVGVS